eukprot:2595533-Amphidinium_carterae.1
MGTGRADVSISRGENSCKQANFLGLVNNAVHDLLHHGKESQREEWKQICPTEEEGFDEALTRAARLRMKLTTGGNLVCFSLRVRKVLGSIPRTALTPFLETHSSRMQPNRTQTRSSIPVIGQFSVSSAPRRISEFVIGLLHTFNLRPAKE